MLRADRAHLAARMRQLAMTIREKEATYVFFLFTSTIFRLILVFFFPFQALQL
jgi:hypothetical protein